MTYYIGIDPDLHHTGIAVMSDESKEPVYLGVARVDRKFKQEDAVPRMAKAIDSCLCDFHIKYSDRESDRVATVESQQIYVGTRIRVQDLIPLAQVAGSAIGILSLGDNVLTTASLVNPKDWKGTTSKDNHQQAIKDFFSYYFKDEQHVLNHWKIKKSELSHVVDAIGLALWGIIRDQLPRSADRDEELPIRGSVVSRQRLDRLRFRSQTPR